ncbi:MAG: DUF1015 domain-containing protein [Desulfobacteraceae bacterium]|nr:DUF1015 domain-containing protein [Desulfobacteraceae bacterium]
MAVVIPFRGISYNSEKISDLSLVTAPPYDVISPQEQDEFYRCHPQNIIRLILGKKTDQDSPDNNPHTRAAARFTQWQSENILIRDNVPALYVTGLDFQTDGQMKRRLGLIALVKLETFDKGIVLPHERTFSKVKSERLELMKVCHANFSPIFSLYPGNGVSEILTAAISGRKPDTDFTDSKGHRHTMWKLTDPAIHHQVSQAMSDRKIYIADGHHRYETALNYRSWLASQTPSFSPDHPANYVLMYLCGMNDPGLVVLPAHRIVRHADKAIIENFPNHVKSFFDIRSFADSSEYLSALGRSPKNTIGAVIKNSAEYYLLTPKPGIMDKLFSDELPEALRQLDVSVLTHLILMKIFGFDQNKLDTEGLISYSSITDDAIKAVRNSDADASFILNATKIEQVKLVAEKGLIMPRKSTYFIPKSLPDR